MKKYWAALSAFARELRLARVARFASPLLVSAALVLPGHSQPLPNTDFTFTITTSDPVLGDGFCDTPDPDDDFCAHTLNSVTVSGTTYTTLTYPSNFTATGFTVGADVQSRINNVIGDFEFGDAGYEANMLANVFTNSNVNAYQQVGDGAGAGTFTHFFSPAMPATDEFFFVITERNGNNAQNVEAFDEDGVSLGSLVVSGNGAGGDYADTGADVGLNQNAYLAVIPMDTFFDAGDPTRRVAYFEVFNQAVGGGGDHKIFVIGNAVAPAAIDDEDLNNDQGTTVSVDVLDNDIEDAPSTFVPSTVTIFGSAGAGQPLVVAGEGTWSVNTTTGAIIFTPLPEFADDPTPISYTVADTTSETTNRATVTITYLIDPEITLVKTISDVADTNGSGTIGDAGDVITYDFLVTNSGNTSLSDVSITDAMLGLTDAAASPTALAPGETAVLNSVTYTITAIDFVLGEVENTATTTGTPVATVGGVADPNTPLVDGSGTPLSDVSDTSDTGSESAVNGGTPVVVPNPGTTDTNGILGDDADEPTLLILPAAPAGSSTIPPNPTANCTWNWYQWQYPNAFQSAPLDLDQYDPTSPINNPAGPGLFSFETTALGTNAWYTTTDTGFTPFFNLADNTFPTESTDANLSERHYGVGAFFLEPGTSQSFTVTDPAADEGHVFAVFDSAGVQIARYPTFAEFSGGEQFYVSRDGGAGPFTNELRVTSAWSDTFTFTVPADGEAYVHYIMVDENAFSNFATTNLCAEPAIAVTKAASIGLADADGSAEVTYTITVENTGPVSLEDLTLIDDLAATDQLGAALQGVVSAPVVSGATATGSTPPSANASFDGDANTNLVIGTDGTLAPGDSYTVTFTVNVNPNAAGAPATLQNTATGGGTSIVDATDTVTDLSDNSADAGNEGTDGVDTSTGGTGDTTGDDNPTVITIEAPAINLVKSVASLDDTNANGFFGDAGDEVTYDFLVTNTGTTALESITISDAMLTGSPFAVPDLAIGADATISGISYTITSADVTAGFIDNTATVTGTPTGTISTLPDVTDTSDTGTEPDLDASNTPITVPNPETTDTNGTPGDDADEPTVLNLPTLEPELTLTKAITNLADTNANSILGDEGDTLTYTFEVENTGNTSLADITISDSMLFVGTQPISPDDLAPGDTGTAGPFAYVIQASDIAAGEVVNTATATGTPVATLPGNIADPTTPLLDAGGAPLADVSDVSDTGSEPTVAPDGSIIPVVDPPNEDTNGTSGDDTDEPTVIIVPVQASAAPTPGLTITKTTPDSVVTRGQTVPYTITIDNQSGFDVGPVEITDTLPAGFIYVAGSAELDGTPVAVTATASTVTFPGVSVLDGDTLTATLTLRILTGTNPGEYVNTAVANDPLLGLTIGPATATVRILPEAIFDCGEVIGRVFNDLDGDGYQDPFADAGQAANRVIVPEVTTGFTNFEAPPREEGIAGVRLHTLDGLVITTDEFGRFSVPCASLPADRGSNFLLSLDERTLPLGYQMTTENPRVMRLTPGMLTEMNFGATLRDLVIVDLNGNVVNADGSLHAGLLTGIDALVAYLDQERSGVELVFHVPSDADRATVERAFDIMDLVAAEIQLAWRDVGRGRLTIEQSIARAGQ